MKERAWRGGGHGLTARNATSAARETDGRFGRRSAAQWPLLRRRPPPPPPPPPPPYRRRHPLRCA